jgi:hypothetical protein
MAARPGDVVRFVRASETSSLWFYCRVDDVLPDGDLVCTVVDTQSWPDLILSGVLPGRQYRMPSGSVLSIVRQSH